MRFMAWMAADDSGAASTPERRAPDDRLRGVIAAGRGT